MPVYARLTRGLGMSADRTVPKRTGWKKKTP